MASADTGLRGFLEHHAYLAAMVGLVAYYGVSLVATYGAQGPNVSSPLRYRSAVAATTLGHCAYSLLIGYLIVNRLHLGLLSMALIVLGVIPLLQDVFWVGMSITIMAGLTAGTVITMVLVPVLYSIFYRVKVPSKVS